MISEYTRISHSIDAMDDFRQVIPHYEWIRRFAESFKDVMGVQEKTELLKKQLLNIEL